MLLPFFLIIILISGCKIVYQKETLVKITQGNLSDLKMDGFSERLNWLRLGLEKWREKPLIGWGPYSVEPIMEEYNKKTGFSKSHFHNIYLQILIQIGLIGFLFFVLQYGLLFTAAWEAYCAKWLDFDTI